MTNLEIYNELRGVPDTAKKPIGAGRLKGFTDINPMWRIKRFTEVFGPCGIGWWYKITDKRLEGSGDEIRAFVDIDLYYRWNGEVSQPIPGTGGSSFLTKEKNGAYTSDECYKMALTDALSVAMKSVGLGADVYFEKDRDKYTAVEDAPNAPDPVEEQADRAVKKEGDILYAECDQCGSYIYDWKRKDGNVMPVRDFVINSIKEFGRPLCRECIKAIKIR